MDVVIFIGLQASGKSTFFRSHFVCNLKKMTPPRYQEGFDQLYQILPREGFQFDVLLWPQNEPGSDSNITDV